MDRLTTLFHPSHFQSARRRGGWFEGWYFKLVDAEGSHPVAVIPGVSNDPRGGTSHSFVQVIRPGHDVRYHLYAFEDFKAHTDRLEICVGPNRFSAEGITLDLPETASQPKLRGWVSFGAFREWPVSVLAPGIMGWYRYVPAMECYHAIVSMDHTLDGSLFEGAERLSFENGRGYSEKDWGSSFPSSWIWTQSNSFVDVDAARRLGVSLTCSVAKIPWLGSSFIGHIAGLALDDGRLFRFATYTGSKLVKVETGTGWAQTEMRDRHYELSVRIDGVKPGGLKAPKDGAMTGRADEALDATVSVKLASLGGGTVFEGVGSCAGAEVMNDLDELRIG